MGKPRGFVLGVAGAKRPLPPEAVIEHAKPLQGPKARRGRKQQEPLPVVITPEEPAIADGSAPVIELSTPAAPPPALQAPESES